EKGFIDSFASVTEEPDEHPTWRWPVGRGELTLRLDYIFHTRELKTVESKVLASRASDHSMVFSRLRWEAAEKPKAAHEGDRQAEP
ncbi:MAG: hypothetical protein NUV77_22380, partial [Thermoguttaceae bacterium]|nr:hypothetical protein [Thermoguttaceae bacterium]